VGCELLRGCAVLRRSHNLERVIGRWQQGESLGERESNVSLSAVWACSPATERIEISTVDVGVLIPRIIQMSPRTFVVGGSFAWCHD
jgi:hypothetical protein